MPVTIRRASPADAGAIAGIFRHYVENTVVTFAESAPTARDWEQRIAEGRPFLVAEEGHEITGFAHVSPWRRQEAYRITVEDAVYVVETAVGRGHGTALLTGLIAACRRAGYEQMVAVIVEDAEVGAASIRLHSRCGFRNVGLLTAVGSKRGRRIDTRLMQLDLTAIGSAQGR